MDRQEGYYWVKYKGVFEIALYNKKEKFSGYSIFWTRIDSETVYFEDEFEHINEVKIKNPGELPD